MQSRSLTVDKAFVYASFALIAGTACSSSSGGNSSSGGAANGGAVSTGGASAGGASAGGSVSNVSGSGGLAANGGAVSNGGVSSNGGSTSHGGAVSMGGGNAGGAVSMGGSSAGGAPSMGGHNAVGGGTASGGRPANGGSSGGGAENGGGSATGGAQTSSGGQSSATCPTTVLASGDSTKKITVGGLSREYILHVPSTYKGTSATPLVLDFHPIGGSDTSWRSGSPYPAVLDKEGVITVYPNGEPSPNLGNAWNVEKCCVSKINGAEVDDVAFAKALVTEIEKVACIDPKRVYAVGFSMGGGMSNYLACHAADVFAAVGPASFDLTKQNVDGCKPARPITVVEWRGKNDMTVAYAGGYSNLVTGMAIDFLGAVGTFQKWAELDGCTGSPAAADSNNCQTYTQCSGGVQVTLCTNNNGGHEAAKADVVWPMLKKYSLP